MSSWFFPAGTVVETSHKSFYGQLLHFSDDNGVNGGGSGSRLRYCYLFSEPGSMMPNIAPPLEDSDRPNLVPDQILSGPWSWVMFVGCVSFKQSNEERALLDV